MNNLEKLLVGGISVDGDGDPDADTGLGRQLDERSDSLLSVFALGIILMLMIVLLDTVILRLMLIVVMMVMIMMLVIWWCKANLCSHRADITPPMLLDNLHHCLRLPPKSI